LFEVIKHPSDSKTCFKVEAVEQEADLIMQRVTIHSPLEKALMNDIDCLTNEEEKDLGACLEGLDKLKETPLGEYAFEELKKDNPVERAKVELKVFPAHLKYVFLEENDPKPVVINNELSSDKEAWLVEVLKKHKAAIGWHIFYLEGISPSYCMHKIIMDGDYRPMRQP